MAYFLKIYFSFYVVFRDFVCNYHTFQSLNSKYNWWTEFLTIAVVKYFAWNLFQIYHLNESWIIYCGARMDDWLLRIMTIIRLEEQKPYRFLRFLFFFFWWIRQLFISLFHFPFKLFDILFLLHFWYIITLFFFVIWGDNCFINNLFLSSRNEIS